MGHCIPKVRLNREFLENHDLVGTLILNWYQEVYISLRIKYFIYQNDILGRLRFCAPSYRSDTTA